MNPVSLDEETELKVKEEVRKHNNTLRKKSYDKKKVLEKEREV